LREERDELESMYCDTRSSGFGAEVKRRILMGTFALSAGYYDAYYKRAQQVRTLVQRDYASALGSVDALISPVSPVPAWKLGDKVPDPLAMYAADIMTINVNLAGLPAIVVPCGYNSDLPVGLQITGRSFAEADLLKYAHIYEQTTEWTTQAPALLG